MIILQILLGILTFLLVPTLVGYGFVEFTNLGEKTFPNAIVYGYLILWALFTVICIPLIALKASLTLLTIIYTVSCLILCAAVLVTSPKIMQTIVGKAKVFWKKRSFMTLATFLMVLMMVILQVVLMHSDADDAEYVAMATTSIHTNTLMQYDAYTGGEIGYTLLKRLVAPFPMLMTYYSKIMGIHPAIFCHTVFAPMMIILCYFGFFCLGNVLYKGDREKVDYFLFFLSVCILFGGYSSFSLGERMLLRIWQGKSLLMAFVIPFMFMLFNYLEGKKLTFRMWIGISLLVLGGSLTSLMADILLPIMFVGMALAVWIHEHSFKRALFLGSTCLPCGLFLLLYIGG